MTFFCGKSPKALSNTSREHVFRGRAVYTLTALSDELGSGWNCTPRGSTRELFPQTLLRRKSSCNKVVPTVPERLRTTLAHAHSVHRSLMKLDAKNATPTTGMERSLLAPMLSHPSIPYFISDSQTLLALDKHR